MSKATANKKISKSKSNFPLNEPKNDQPIDVSASAQINTDDCEMDERNIYDNSGLPRYETSREEDFVLERDIREEDYDKVQSGNQGKMIVPQSLIDKFPDHHLCWKLCPPDTNNLYVFEREGYTRIIQHGEPIKVSAGSQPGVGFQYLMAQPLVLYKRKMDAIHKKSRDRKKQVFMANASKGQQVKQLSSVEIPEEAFSNQDVIDAIDNNSV